LQGLRRARRRRGSRHVCSVQEETGRSPSRTRRSATQGRRAVIELYTLTDGGQTAAAIASVIGDFVKGAERTLDIALYDFALSDATAAVVVGALRDANVRGVAVRLLYNVDHAMPIPVPAPPRTDPALVA